MPRSWPVAAKRAATADAGVNATDCIPDATAPCVPTQARSSKSSDGRAQDAADGLLRERRLRDHGLAVPAPLEVAVRGLLVAAHVRLEDRPLRADGARLRARSPGSGRSVAGDHVRPDRRRRSSTPTSRGTSSRRRASRSRAASRTREALDRRRPPSHRRISATWASTEPRSVTASPVSSKTKRTPGSCGRAAPRCGSRPTRRLPGRRGRARSRARLRCWPAGRRRPPARAERLRQPAVRLLELVLAELDRERADDRDGDHRDAGSLGRARARLQVVGRRPRRRSAQRILAGADRLGSFLRGQRGVLTQGAYDRSAISMKIAARPSQIPTTVHRVL